MPTTTRAGLGARIRHATNPFVLRLSGRRFSPWGVVEHRGRRSGQAYEVPVEPVVTARHVIVALPYGPRTNWAVNVVAAGGCRLRWRGRTLDLGAPRVLPAAQALPLTAGWKGWFMARLRVADFLVLDR